MDGSNETMMIDVMDMNYIKRGLELIANIGRSMQGNLEDLQASFLCMKQPAPRMCKCKTLQDFLEASCYDENYRYHSRYGSYETNGYYISVDNMIEIDNRHEQLHNRTERLLFKVSGIDDFIQSKM